MRLPLLFIPLFICSTITPLSAQVYKWIDENGKTHYGDKPENDTAESVHIRKKSALDPDHQSRAEKRTRLLNILDEEREEMKQEKAQEAEDKRKLAAKCAQEKKNLEKINNATFMYKKSDDPKNPIVYSHEERQKITNNLKKAIQKYCK